MENQSESANDMPPTGASSPEGKTITKMLELMRNIDDLKQEVAKLPPTVLPTTARPTLSPSFFQELYEDMEARAEEEEDGHDD